MARNFQRRIEDFVCSKCGLAICGNGYTDHCPHCLWSRHVDNKPGDRAAGCGGLMEPRELEIKGGESNILYQCQKCGYCHKVKVAKNDNFEALLEISKKINETSQSQSGKFKAVRGSGY